MRVVQFHTHGGPDVLRVDEAPRPTPGPGELLVRVALAGVTLPVVRQTHGGVPLPHAPGGEVVGRVVATGPDVTGWRTGQRVAGLAFTGAYAEYAVLAVPMATAVPDAVDGRRRAAAGPQRAGRPRRAARRRAPVW